jgi:hypothetical protein
MLKRENLFRKDFVRETLISVKLISTSLEIRYPRNTRRTMGDRTLFLVKHRYADGEVSFRMPSGGVTGLELPQRG